MKKIIISYVLFTMFHLLNAGFGAYYAQQLSNAASSAQNQFLRTSNTTTSSSETQNCPPATNCDNNSNYYIPSFTILLGDSSGNTLNGNGHVFQTPTSFNINNALFMIHIFPKSNKISGSTIKYASTSSEGTYTIAYTLKDPAGLMVYKEFDQGLSNLSKIPHQITLIANPTTNTSTNNASTNTNNSNDSDDNDNDNNDSDDSSQTTQQPATWNTTTSSNNIQIIAQSIFIPPAAQLSSAARQQLINGISPIAQKFLFTQDNGQITATTISGTFDADDTTQTISLAQNPFNETVTSVGSSIGHFGISFDGGTTNIITFNNDKSAIQFNSGDLKQGLMINVCIFPSSNANNYPVIATLRTMDGIKLRKQSTMSSSSSSSSNDLSQTPTTITLTYTSTSGTSKTLLTTSFLNANASNANQIFNVISPLNLRFVVFRTSRGNFMTNMM